MTANTDKPDAGGLGADGVARLRLIIEDGGEGLEAILARLAGAQAELDAAAETILEQADCILSGEDAQAAALKILEASSFHDLVSQRLTRATVDLRQRDRLIEAVLDGREAPDQADGRDPLLDGPGGGLDQAAADALFKGV